MNLLSKILNQKWKDKQLPHFLILRSNQGAESLENFATNQLSLWLQNDLGISHEKALERIEMGHPDILWIKTTERQYYWSKTQNDFYEYQKFKEHSPLELELKVVLISQVHLLTESIMNKLLKDLEDSKDILFLFLHHSGTKILPTIESRSIMMTLPRSEKFERPQLYEHLEYAMKAIDSLPEKFKKYLLEGKDEHKLLESFKKDKMDEYELFKKILEIESHYQKDYTHKWQFLQEVRHFMDSKTYNNPSKERFFQLLNTLRT